MERVEAGSGVDNSGGLGVDLNDLRRQISELKRMRSVRKSAPRQYDLVVRISSPNQTRSDWSDFGDIDFDREIKRIQGIIDSMTPRERMYPVLLTVPKRCLRIAAGAGVEPSEVSALFTQFKALRDMTFAFELSGWRKV
jgi:signal recognition particle subunit SRP54